MGRAFLASHGRASLSLSLSLSLFSLLRQHDSSDGHRPSVRDSGDTLTRETLVDARPASSLLSPRARSREVVRAWIFTYRPPRPRVARSRETRRVAPRRAAPRVILLLPFCRGEQISRKVRRARFTRYRRRRNPRRMNGRERKIFRLASGQPPGWDSAEPRPSSRGAPAECNDGQRERGRERDQARLWHDGGREEGEEGTRWRRRRAGIVTAAGFTRSRWTGCQAKEGGGCTSLSTEKGEALSRATCDSNK